jgi:2-dehydro-3-deoxyphosphogalactonate aldolase
VTNNSEILASDFLRRLVAMPVVAILRGVEPDEVEGIAEELVSRGITLIEVPLNSPDPFRSIERMAKRFAGRALIGAGTVLTFADVARCHDAGSQLIVSPNMRADIISATVSRGMISAPGCMTPTEIFAALDAGAHAVKLFPGEIMSPAVVKAMRAVLPVAATVLVVGGVNAGNMDAFRAAGATGFGVGSSLYRKGMTKHEVAQNADAFLKAM